MALDRTSKPARPSVAVRAIRGGLAVPFSELVEIAAGINARLMAAGSSRSIDIAHGDAVDRDRISTELVFALQASGDRRCFDLLYRLNAPFVLNFCRARLRGNEFGIDPHDVLEDTFLNIWLKHDRFAPRSNTTFTGWALVVAEHLVLQALRAHRRERERVQSASTCGELAHHDDPSRHIESDEHNDRLAADWALLVAIAANSLDHLSARARAVLTLRDIDGLSYREIATRLTVSKAYVGMMIRRGRNRLIEAMHCSLRPPEAAAPAEKSRRRSRAGKSKSAANGTRMARGEP